MSREVLSSAWNAAFIAPEDMHDIPVERAGGALRKEAEGRERRVTARECHAKAAVSGDGGARELTELPRHLVRQRIGIGRDVDALY